MTSLAAANVGPSGTRKPLPWGRRQTSCSSTHPSCAIARTSATRGIRVGIESVWVNGGRVFDHGASLQVFSGVGLSRTGR